MGQCLAGLVETKGEEGAVQPQGASEVPCPLISEVVAAEIQSSERVVGSEGEANVSTK